MLPWQITEIKWAEVLKLQKKEKKKTNTWITKTLITNNKMKTKINKNKI